eukprot:INCI17556.5.p1 GENE.INCI17556.5~~INCI17556.5.p1  ORF type:complete len:1057 (-),score=145.00 INCI17556.5:2555-5311(-)
MAHRRKRHHLEQLENNATGSPRFGKGHPLHHSASAEDVERYHIMREAGLTHGNTASNPLVGMHQRQVRRSAASGRFHVEPTQVAERAKRVVDTMIRTRNSLRWKSLEAKINKRRTAVRQRSPVTTTSRESFSAARLLAAVTAHPGRSGGFNDNGDNSHEDATSSDGTDDEGNALIAASPISTATESIFHSSPRGQSLSPGAGGGGGAARGSDPMLPAITSPISRSLMMARATSREAQRADEIAMEAESETMIQRARQRQQHASLLQKLRGGTGTTTNPHNSVSVPASAGAMRSFMALPRSSAPPTAASAAAAARQYFSQQHKRGIFGGASSVPGGARSSRLPSPIQRPPRTSSSHSLDAHDDGAALALSNTRADQWACKICTFINARVMEVCEMCEAPRPAGRRRRASCSMPMSGDLATLPTAHNSVRRVASLDASLPSLSSLRSPSSTITSPSQISPVQLHGATPTSLFLMWDAPTADGGSPVVGYILESRRHGASPTRHPHPWSRMYFGIAANYLATNLVPDTEYAMRVAAINSEGLQATFSTPVTFRTLDDPTGEQGFEIPPLRVWGLWAEYWDPPSHCCYYFNRQSHASSWEMPAGMKAALESSSPNGDGKGGLGGGGHAGQKTSFKMKRYRVLMNLRTDEFQGFQELTIRRDLLLADSFATLNDLSPDQWRRKFKIVFKYEDGMDAGGLSKDWFLQVSKAACHPGSGLFRSGPAGLLMPAPASGNEVRSQCRKLEVFGQFMAKAIRDRQVLDIPLCPFVLKHILGLQNNMGVADVADIDPQLSQSLLWMQENPVEDLGLDMYFTVSVNSSGHEPGSPSVREQNLLPEGSSRLVTEDNKHRYVQLLVEWYTQKVAQVQLKFLCRGFHSLLPLDVIKVFTVEELQLLLNSTAVIDIRNALRAGATYSVRSGCSLS